MKKAILTAFIPLLSLVVYGQAGFEKTYGGELAEWFRALLPVANGQWVAGGGTKSYGQGNSVYSDGYVVMLDSMGNELWYRYFGAAYNDEVLALLPHNNRVIAAGYNIPAGASYYDFYTATYDLEGLLLQEKFYGGAFTEACYDAIVASDGSFILCGLSNTFTNGGNDVYLIRTDTAGIQTDDAHFGGTSNESANALIETADGGFVVAGYTSSGTQGQNMYLAKTDEQFNLLWERNYGSPNDETAFDLAEDGSGNLWILGSWQNGPDSSDMVLIKTDANGENPEYHWPGKKSGDFGWQLHLLNSGDMLIAGYAHAAGKESEVLLEKLNPQGDTIWTRRYGGLQADLAFTTTTDALGNILLAGQTEGFGTYQVDAYLLKLDENGSIPCPAAVSFEASSPALCEDQTVFFTNTTVSSQDFLWLSNGQTIAATDAAFYYNEAGTYDINLTACSATTTQQVTVWPKPPVHFTYSNNGNWVQFNLAAGIIPETISWNFGDGSPLNTLDTNPLHLYSIPGMYWVILEVMDAQGCDSTYVEQINLVTGLPEEARTGFTLTPNPASDFIWLQTPETAASFTLEFRDITGKMMRLETVPGGRQQVNVEWLVPGVYWVRCFDPAGRGMRFLLIRK